MSDFSHIRALKNIISAILFLILSASALFGWIYFWSLFKNPIIQLLGVFSPLLLIMLSGLYYISGLE